MLILALILAVVIGVILGLLGGGGSLLTVPLLTYVVGLDPKPAITSSLFVVAITSAIATISHARAGRVRWRTGLPFGGAGMLGAYLGGRLAAQVPAHLLLIGFAALMFVAGVVMLRGRRAPVAASASAIRIVAMGLVIGAVVGLVGAGGGFIVVPALMFGGGLAIETAVGTALLVIAMQSAAGFVGHVSHVDVEWTITLEIVAATVVGTLIGAALTSRISPARLQRGFGGLVIAMAIAVIAIEVTRYVR